MKNEVTDEQARGKVLTKIVMSHVGRQAIIVFSDGTFTTIGIDRGYDYGDETIVSEPLAWREFGLPLLIEAGVMSQEQADEHMARQIAEHQERERREYERLRKRFES